MKPKKKMRAMPGGLKLGGLSLDIDQINKEHSAREKQQQNNI